MTSENTHPQRAVIVLSIVVAALAAASAFLADRRGGIDEIGLVNPVYMKLHYGRMTYPVHGYFDGMFVHPPLHYALIAAVMRLGVGLYYAEAIPTFLTVMLCILAIVRCSLPAALKMGLLYGLAIASTTFDGLAFENYGMRPENQLAAALLAGLVLLEWARIDAWSKQKLFAGAFLVVFAAGLQYYAWPAVLTVCIYAVFLVAALGWNQARQPLAALAGGALSIGIPYLTFFVFPNAHAILAFLRETKVAGVASPVTAHVTAYHDWAGMQLGIGPVWLAFRIGVPMVVVSTLLLLTMRSTRTMAVAALPVQVSLLLFAWHKHAYYYYPEIQLYCAAILSAGVVLADRYLTRLHRRGLQASLWYGVAAVCGTSIWITGTTYKNLHWTVQPRVHEMEIARAAGREMLGTEARVGSRIGAWYSSGAAYWHRISPELFWNPLAPAFNVTTYLANFDAIAENQHMSYETRNGRGKTAASWYQDGSWQLRGFFFSEVNPEISYLLFAATRRRPLTGFGLREGRMYRFTEEPGGDQEFVSLACPLGQGVCVVGEGKAKYLEWSRRCPQYAADTQFLSVIFLPEKPGRFEMDAMVSVVLLAGKSRTYLGAHPECRLVQEIRGSVTPVDQHVLIAKLRREDRPIRFYEQAIDMPGVPRVIGDPPPEDAIRLTRAIKLERMKLVNDKASITSGTPWKVVTAPGMGAYAASIPIDAPAVPVPCWIHFRVTVSKGTIGLGILNRRRRDFLTEPLLVPVGQLPVDVYISLPSLVGADEVIVRSAEAASASEVTLHEADLRVGKQDWVRSRKELGGIR